MERWMTLLGLAASLALAGCSPRRPEARFWEWFQTNAARVHEAREANAPALEELARELSRVREGLTYELGPVRSGVRELALSADGRRALFPTVRALVDAAPALPGWKVVALRQRKAEVAAVELEDGFTLGPGDVWFVAAAGRAQEPVTLRLFLRGFSEAQRAAYSRAARRLLEDTLGEHDVEMKLGAVDIAPLPSQPQTDVRLQPLSELPRVVDAVFPPARP